MKGKRGARLRDVAGGLVAAGLMDGVQFAWALAFERERQSGDSDEETEAITNVVAVLTRIAPELFPRSAAPLLGRAIHYAFGAAFAAAYGSVVGRRRPTVARGAAFGVLLWLLSDRILIPLFKLGRPWSRYSPAERSNAFVSHLAYALAVEFTRWAPPLNQQGSPLGPAASRALPWGAAAPHLPLRDHAAQDSGSEPRVPPEVTR